MPKDSVPWFIEDAHPVATEEWVKLVAQRDELLVALDGMLKMVSNVLTDPQLNHPQCGTTIRNAIQPALAAIAKVKGTS